MAATAETAGAHSGRRLSSLSGGNCRAPRGELRRRRGMENVVDYHFECAPSPECQTAYDLPRFAAFGGTGGSIAASTGLRFALGAFNIVGIIVGPALAAWSITQEIRNVRKAHRELDATRMQRQDELARYTARTRQLERQLTAAKPPADVVAS